MPSIEETVSVARSMRREGKLLREIAEALGICVATASAWTRGVLAYRKPADDPRKSTVLPLLKQMYSNGSPISEIAEQTGVPASTLYDWRRGLGLVRNKRSNVRYTRIAIGPFLSNPRGVREQPAIYRMAA